MIMRNLLGMFIILISVVTLSITVATAVDPDQMIERITGSETMRKFGRKLESIVKHKSSQKLYRLYSFGLCSSVFCEHGPAKLDPVAEKCCCPWASASLMAKSPTRPNQRCREMIDCHYPFEPTYDRAKHECICSVVPLPPWGSHRLVTHDLANQSEILRSSRRFWAWIDFSATNRVQKKRLTTATDAINLHKDRRQLPTLTGAVSQAPNPSYIPPPPIEVTQELLQQSMTIQPQKLATVGSVIPHFAEGVITFFLQLDGPIAQTLTINATDTLPCDSIGTQPQPNVILVPRTVKDGTPEVTIPTCLVLAVNIYNPLWITYWIQKQDGSIFSLTSDNKVHDIDRLDLSVPAALSIRVNPTGTSVKRESMEVPITTPIKRRQLYQVPCDGLCPNPVSNMLDQGSSSVCGCMLDETNKHGLLSRALEAPNAYTATMTAEVCAAMTCINNGNQAAVFNPFSRTCWCAAPTFVETNPSADNTAM